MGAVFTFVLVLMIPRKNYNTNNGEPDCFFAPSTVGNSASSASALEEN